MSSKPDLLIVKALPDPQMDALAAACTLHRLDLAEGAARDTVLAAAGPVCRVAVTNGAVGLGGVSLTRLPALGLLACSSAGYEGIDAEALAAAGVGLATTSRALCDDVADTALMLMLAVRRDLRRADAYVRSGAWARDGMYPLQSAMRGKRLGLVGAGTTGQAIARRAAVLGMEVAYTGRRPRADVALPYQPDLLALAGWADVLVLAIAGGADTRHMVNADVLAALGPAGSLVNIARGSVVDEAALIAALEGGVIASAGLDVFENEPDPDPRLTALENVTLYPHHASGTRETRAAMADAVVEDVTAYFAGQTPPGLLR